MTLKWIAYLLLITAISLLGLIKWKQFSQGERIILVLIVFTVITESFSLFAALRWHNNLPIYHLYNPVEFFLLSLYFNCSLTFFRRNNIGIICGVAGVVLSLINTLYLQRPDMINSNFLVFEGAAVIIYCLLSIHQILLEEEHLPYRFAHFWITICCLIYWSSTFTGWGLYAILDKNDIAVVSIFDKILSIVNFIFYTGLAAVFLFYKKLIPSCRA